jgi:hypothetical protein
MDADSLDIGFIYNTLQEEWNPLDKQLGRFGRRLMHIRELPQLERDLYLVLEIVAMTCNKGTGRWIQHHHEEPGWIDCSVEAFIRIGYPGVGSGIKSCLGIVLLKGNSMTYEDDIVPSHYIMDHEHQIIRSLYAYLLDNGYRFANSKPA